MPKNSKQSKRNRYFYNRRKKTAKKRSVTPPLPINAANASEELYYTPTPSPPNWNYDTPPVSKYYSASKPLLLTPEKHNSKKSKSKSPTTATRNWHTSTPVSKKTTRRMQTMLNNQLANRRVSPNEKYTSVFNQYRPGPNSPLLPPYK